MQASYQIGCVSTETCLTEVVEVLEHDPVNTIWLFMGAGMNECGSFLALTAITKVFTKYVDLVNLIFGRD